MTRQSLPQRPNLKMEEQAPAKAKPKVAQDKIKLVNVKVKRKQLPRLNIPLLPLTLLHPRSAVKGKAVGQLRSASAVRGNSMQSRPAEHAGLDLSARTVCGSRMLMNMIQTFQTGSNAAGVPSETHRGVGGMIPAMKKMTTMGTQKAEMVENLKQMDQKAHNLM